MSSSALFAGDAGINESPNFPLRVVDGLTLPPEYRKALRPGEDWNDANGHPWQLPRYFYEVPSWDAAMKIELATHFLLWEFIQVDVREAPPLRTFPRYVPCAITLLAVCLERFREAVGIGDTFLDNRSAIERFSLVARQTLPGIWTRPYGAPTGYAEDHLHLDLGYVLSVPRDAKS